MESPGLVGCVSGVMFGQKVMIICSACLGHSINHSPLASSLLLPPSPSSSSCPRPSITPYPTHTRTGCPSRSRRTTRSFGQALASSNCFQTTASNCFFTSFSMAAQSGFFVAKPSTSTTILCTPQPQDALRQGEGHAGPAARPRGGERAAL